MTSPPVSLCETIHGLLAADDGNALTASERALVESHLATCTACRHDEVLRAHAGAALAALPAPGEDLADLHIAHPYTQGTLSKA